MFNVDDITVFMDYIYKQIDGMEEKQASSIKILFAGHENFTSNKLQQQIRFNS